MELYDFYADWCGMCRTMMPIVDDFQKQHPEVNLIKINVDDEPELAEKYNVSHLPTFVFSDGTKVLYKCNRMLSSEDLEEIYQKSLKKC